MSAHVQWLFHKEINLLSNQVKIISVYHQISKSTKRVYRSINPFDTKPLAKIAVKLA